MQDDSLISTEITRNSKFVRTGKWMNNGHSEETTDDITNSQENAQFMENLLDEASNFLANQTSLDGTKVHTSTIAPTLLIDSTRRRQMSNFEKIMALTCQKCGQ
ncbi:hypothetical protein WUBG_18476, partial [Wuchereria bancrofti]